MGGYRHKKHFGQHFLIDETILLDLDAMIAAAPDDIFVEIGPGAGVLTSRLLDAGATVTAVEVDIDLVQRLKKNNWSNFHVIAADALEFDFQQLQSDKKLRCVGNLPYNISTPLLFHFFEFLDLWQDMHFMLQQEVVLRLAAEVGSKHYSRLSVMAQAITEVTALTVVPADAFDPPPKVESQIVSLIPKPQAQRQFCYATLTKVVKTAFAHRRKTLRNNFKGVFNTDDWEKLSINPSLRPQDLLVSEYIKLADYLNV